ncbi:MAG: hypothetical protein Q9227_006539 [Pyrenula ochraceoflavens]
MKFFAYALAFVGISGFTSAALDPSILKERDATTNEYTLVLNLFNNVLSYDANINATVAGLDRITVLLNPNTVFNVRSDISALTDAVNAAAAEAPDITKRYLAPDARYELAARQTTGNETLDLADLLAELLTEIDNTINPLLVDLGLGPLVTDLITPLEDALVALVRGVGAVVDGLVAALYPILEAIASAVGAILGPVLGLLGL